jgi:MinD-like ATPase involved in chromosome partitioning or flagellar assembly
VPARAGRRRRPDLISRVQAPVPSGQHSVVVLSLKGGVGKTTVTAGLGSTLASVRGERIIAVDANPDRGTLSDKVTLETAATIRDLLTERDQILSYADMRAFTSRAASGLEILASDQDPALSEAFGAEDYASVRRILADFYSICLTDCGTGLLHSAMAEVLRHADQIVLASTPAVDSARSADATLDWLTARGYGDLARHAVLVLSAVRPRSRSTVSLDLLDEHFSARCRAVARLPFDVRLDEGAEVELDQLSRKTADAFLELAALVADGFGAAGPATGAGLRQAWPRTHAGAW